MVYIVVKANGASVTSNYIGPRLSKVISFTSS